MNYVIRELDKKYLGVVDQGSNFVAFTKINSDIKDKLVLSFISGSRNGEGVLFLINELQKKTPDGKVYIKSNSVLVIPHIIVSKIKEENLLVILDH